MAIVCVSASVACYRPSNLDSSGFCHPVLVWANGHGDNPEQHPPECIVDPATNTWCGTYPGLMNQLASHGFVVIASLSTTTSRGEPLPTIAGLNWLLEQAEDASTPYFHHLDTARIGALGHSEGGASTSMAAADPRISAIATVSGTRALTGLHGPALLICLMDDQANRQFFFGPTCTLWCVPRAARRLTFPAGHAAARCDVLDVRPVPI